MKTLFKGLLFSLLFAPIIGFGQTQVNGTVTEQSSTLPLPGVNVIIKGTASGTATDFDGNYNINVNNGDVLVFSFIGYQTQEIAYNGQATLNVQLVEDASVLDEVVVIGYGSVRKEDLTGTADLITSDDFNQGPVVSAQQLIAGKVAGVSVTSGSGAPGDGQLVRIRGNGSLSLTNNPLYVLDGIPLDDGGVGGSRNPLNILNPNDIESMVVLKDASATAIYGSRAANGVILITTKKGKDTDFRFNIHSKVNFLSPVDKVDVWNAEQVRGYIQNILQDPAAVARLGNADTDWQNEIYTDAVGTDHSFSALGAAWGIPMRASLGYTDQDGTLETDNFTRTTASLTLTPSLLDDHLKIDLNARGMYTENKFANRDAIGNAATFDPTQPVMNGDPLFGGYFAWIDPSTGYQLNLANTNPVALIDFVDDTAEVKRLIANAKFDYNLHFFPDVTATINVGIDKSDSNGRKITSDLIPTSDQNFSGSISRYSNELTNKLFDAYITYKKSINDIHNITFVAGHSYQSFETNNSDSTVDYTTGEESGGGIDKSENVLLSYFGRANYDYKGKYLLTATLRADASSKLNPKDQWGYFPSAALAWNMHREDFMEGSVFNELKLRIGYGEIGNVNGLGDYQFLTRYTGNQSTAGYQFGTGFYQTYRPEPINDDLRWEVGKTINFGVDYAILNNRISGSVNVYKKETQDLIASAFVDPFTNFGNRVDANIGDMENRGIEFTINVIPIQTEDFEWTIGYNVAFNDNEVTSLPFNQPTGGISGGVGNNVQIHTEGQVPYSYLVYQQVYDANTGMPIEGVYVDRNGDDIINDDDRYLYKSPFADVLMGLNTNVSYKNWDFALVSRASLGNYNYNNVDSANGYLRRLTQNNIIYNLPQDVLNTRFVETTENNLLSDYYVQEASFFKIDNITLGYSMPDIIKDIDLRLYASLQNVLTITDYEGIDPEIISQQANSTQLSAGIDNNFYPRPRIFTLGVNIDF
ncbi:SusC/RagA family TonB-linked outer membrane protein [Yeosuana sp. MJ-SS3]|uniref:SusC/RagA family TonB-linked outer membrane protein n=1 Tax=Gilvirhabdus luticola TaxID=3079858 RepID=A0ABU3U4T1_9FLAO|nr:SusC/RagA family TonB-linked outer membrane protein [Yeosuana sp. MJ-SS3]MDU8885120.1 SusC/RagA family TonB-linked outer membrane protein [Yeosuana sp. MJ-SS3]